MRHLFGFILLFVLGSAQAAALVLYDGALGGLPSDQGMVFSAFPPGSVTPSAAGGVTNLNSTGNNAFQAGFGTISPLALNAATGYSLEFTAEIVAESHSGNVVRAGFSVIVVGDDPTASIEIGFQDGRVFAQNDAPLFGHPPADSNPGYNPVGMGLVEYSLTIVGAGYSLSANDIEVLNGSLRDYTGFGLPPYTLPNSIFLGDNTSSAKANLNLSKVALVNPPPLHVKIQELYIGILGRAADRPGMDYWADQINAGVFTLENTRAAFTDPAQTEYTEIYGGLNSTQLVTAIYENFLERAPEFAGLNYWVGELDSGRVNADQMINAIINTVQDPDATGAQSAADLATLQNKTAAAIYFTEKTKGYVVDLNYKEVAKAVVADVTDDPETLAQAKAVIDEYVGI
jgi:hypothetical protein